MKIPEITSDVELDGEFEETDMQIEASAHAFSVLSKGLYSDPHRAIVRELCCNARDSHVDAGKPDLPFEVCLPNAMAPTFAVRDYGVGISPEKIKTLYTYFKSTKQHTNEQTGFFGLGSKSPFAYTRKFTAVSYYNGKKYHFSVHLNDKGIPATTLMSTEDTTESNGLEVSFFVEQGDFHTFTHAVKTALRPFEIKPKLRGIHSDHGFWQAMPKPFLEGAGWKLYSGHTYGQSACPITSPTAVMGKVEYPLKYSGVSGFSKQALSLLTSALLVEFPNGSFEITPAREAIQWTEYSINNINERLEAIYDEIVTYVTKQISGAPTLWKANIASQKLVEQGPLSLLGLKPTWNGQSVTGKMVVPADINLMYISAEYPRATEHRSKNTASVDRQTGDVRPHETTFYFADARGAMARVSDYVRDHFDRHQTCYVIVPIDETVEDDKRYIEFKAKNPTGYCQFQPTVVKRTPVYDKARLPAFLKAFGLIEKDVLMASSLPQRPRVVTPRDSRLAGTKARAFLFDNSGRGEASDHYWHEHEVDFKTDKGVYVELSKWQFVGSMLGKKPCEFRRWLYHFQQAGMTLPDVGLVGVKTADLKKFKSASNWMKLDDYVLSSIHTQWAKPDFQLAYKVLMLFGDQTFLERLGEIEITDDMSDPFKQLVVQANKIYAMNGAVHAFERCVVDGGFMDQAWVTQVRSQDTASKDLVSLARKRYPLLPVVLQYRDRSVKNKEVIRYAKFIDNEGK